jgi:hypothetical protein
VLNPIRLENKEDLLSLVREKLDYVRDVARDLEGSARSVSTGGLSYTRGATQTFTSALSSDVLVQARAEAAAPYLLEYYANDGLVQDLRRRLGAPLPPQAGA